MELKAKNIHVKANGVSLLQDVSINLNSGELVALLGPNGAGKTTLLRAVMGYAKAENGNVTLGGDDVMTLSPETRARRVAYLPQTRPLAWPNVVQDVVALGRYAYGVNLSRLTEADAEVVGAAIADCDIAHLADRKADRLSGGELARVHCARVFAAQAPLLIADEPVAALDPRHQFRVMDLIKGYVAKGGGALVVLHDISLAARYADRLIWLKEGRVQADGPPQETLTEERLAEIYGVKAHIDGIKVEVFGAL